MEIPTQTVTREVTWADEDGRKYRLIARASFDDECHNGHATFSLTGELSTFPEHRARWVWIAGGCLHEDIAKRIPELERYIKWHLCSTDGPMYYISNTVYLAGDKDCWGHRKGEPSSWQTLLQVDNFPVSLKVSKSLETFLQDKIPPVQVGDVIEVPHEDSDYPYRPKYEFSCLMPKEWYQCSFDTRREAEEYKELLEHSSKWHLEKVPISFSKGKERELDAARRAAIWPDATDEDLTAPGLKERLKARLPQLLKDFRDAMESLGFTWPEETKGGDVSCPKL